MTLFDARVQYFALPKAILTLSTKNAIITALTIYKNTGTALFQAPPVQATSYLSRQLTDVQRELIEKGVLTETDDGLRLVDLDPKTNSEALSLRVVFPYQFAYETLSLTCLKTIIACHSLSRYGRRGGLLKQQYFEIITTQSALAIEAGGAERGIGLALKKLKELYLLKTERVRKDGSKTARTTKITLVEPGSGIELSFLGDYFLEQARRVPVHDRYKFLLSHLDPKDKLKDIREGIPNYRVCCPICKSCKGPTFQFDSTEEGDHWRCFNCRRSGTSEFLWAKYSRWSDYTDWRTIMSDNGVTAPLAIDPALDGGDYTAHTDLEEMEQPTC